MGGITISLTELKLCSIQTLQVEWTAKPRLLWLWENWEKLAILQEIRGRNHVAKRRMLEPVYYCIIWLTKYKLIVTLEYITVRSEWMTEWMELSSCDCAAANSQASCVIESSTDSTLIWNWLKWIGLTLPLPKRGGGVRADPQRFFFDNFWSKQLRNIKLCIM